MLAKLKFIGLFCLSLLFSCFTLLTPAIANYNTANLAAAGYNSNSRSLFISQNNTTKTNLSTLPFYWDFINVGIEVQNNGDMLVTESHRYVFNREYTNERYRYIPLDRVDEIKDVTVTENNEVIPIEVGKENNQLWIKWQHELNAPEAHTFKISYRVIGGLQVEEDTIQVYWKAIFEERKSPIQNAKVIVKLPESLAGKITSFTHYPAEIPVSERQLDSTTIEFVARQPVPPEKQLEVQVVFPNDILNVKKPQWQQTSWLKIIGTFTFILFWGILIIFFRGKNSSGTHHSSGSGGGSGGGGGGGGGGG